MIINQTQADKIFLNSSSAHSQWDWIIFIHEITITATAIHQIKIAEKSTKIFAIHSNFQISQNSELLFQRTGFSASAIFSENEIKINHKIANQNFVQNSFALVSDSAQTSKIIANNAIIKNNIATQTIINFVKGTKVHVK